MLRIVADHHRETRDAALRRERFVADDFSYSIAERSRHGSVRLEPEGRELEVSGAVEHYARIRVFDMNGALIGTLAWLGNEGVRWTALRRA